MTSNESLSEIVFQSTFCFLARFNLSGDFKLIFLLPLFWLSIVLLSIQKLLHGLLNKQNFYHLFPIAQYPSYLVFISWAPLVAQMVKNLPEMLEILVQSLGQENPLEKGMATYSNILACRILWTEKPGRSLLQFMNSQRVGHNWMTNLHRKHQKRKVEKAIIYVYILNYHNK